ncbi:hypothetical protein GCM10009623_36650 [Nocardioides aestuarii]|uniref:HNH endonuclease signature motif containing protein n=1 Tax=Nocardioides aestuarii TaxID=252231 RepID=A0ABW4TT82_9ACTN
MLAFVRGQRALADQAEVRLLEAAVQWAVIHPAEWPEDSERYRLRSGGEAPVGLAGPGAPLVAEFSVAEFGAAVGMTPEAGKYYLGHALELRYRLPRLWEQVLTGTVQAWRARRVADATIGRQLSMQAAAFVDAHVAAVAGRIRVSQLDRLVDEAVARHMPETAEQERRDAEDRRCFDIHTDQPSFNGTAQVTGELDLIDAFDLEDAIREGAEELADLGCTESLDVRRSMAAGSLGRRQPTLDFESETTGDEVSTGSTTGDACAAPPPTRNRKPKQKMVLMVALTDAALRGEAGHTVGRCESTRTPVTVETIREWCGNPDAQVVVKPMINLADHVHVDAYEVPDRIREHIALRDQHCVFPWCTRPARSCDCDHVRSWTPDGTGGPTCTCEIAPLCRSHHRLKTHAAWSYTTIEPGTYLWTSPHGYQFLRDHTGTVDVTPATAGRRRTPPRP